MHGLGMFNRLAGIRGQIAVLVVALVCVFVGVVMLNGLFWPEAVEPEAAPDPRVFRTGKEPISPLPLMPVEDHRKVALGQRLFHDTRLSVDGTVSCASCHNLAAGGVDRLVRSRGVRGQEGVINAPTVFNSSLNFRLFWDGRASDLEAQIDGPVQNPVEMGNTWPRVVQTLAADRWYQAEFKAVYAQGVSVANVKDALAAFERTLVTPNAPFDRYLRGDTKALLPEQVEGYRLFKDIGCASCHQGVNVGGNMYQRLGIMEDYFASRPNRSAVDFGRFNITGREEDRFFFRVPPLRNVALTPPYLHNGAAATLEDAIRVMARYQLGTELTEWEVERLRGFLQSLTGEYQGTPLQ